MSSYKNLLTLDEGVKKKATNEKSSTKSKTMGKRAPSKRSRSRSPIKNKKNKPTNVKVPKVEDWDIPDRQYGDLYCKPCDSHMNSDQMWEAHIRGKRHLRTVKKGETGEIKFIYPDEEPLMISKLEDESRPIVGLQHVVEIQRLEQLPIYQCFLCSANVPTPDALIEHIVGTKHRLAYLKEHDPERYKLIQESNLKKGHIEPVVEECIEKHERDKGRGKMEVKREVESSENERAYNYSHTSKAKNYKLPSSKAKNSKNYDFAGSSMLTNKSYRNKDWDCGRSTHSDRSYDGYPDESGRRQPKDFDYYKRSPDRYSYPGRRSPDMLSPDNDYRKRMEINRLQEERYGYPERRPYGFLGASENDRYHSIPHGTSVPFHRPRSALDDNCGDLREVLDKKKTSVEPYLDKYSTTSHHLLEMDDIPEEYLQMIDRLSTNSFLQIAYFKLDRISINTEKELELLDKLSQKITGLSLKIKTNQLPSNLKDQFKQTMVKSGFVNPQFTQDMEQLMNMVGQVKASSNVEGGSSTIQYPDSHITQSAYSTPTYTSADVHCNSGVQPPSFRDYNAPTTNRSSWQHPNSNSSPTDNSASTTNRGSWQHPNASPTANSAMFASSSSSASYIPGLTFTDNQSNDTPSYSSPFEVMSNITKDILGGIRSNTDTHRF